MPIPQAGERCTPFIGDTARWVSDYGGPGRPVRFVRRNDEDPHQAYDTSGQVWTLSGPRIEYMNSYWEMVEAYVPRPGDVIQFRSMTTGEVREGPYRVVRVDGSVHTVPADQPHDRYTTSRILANAICRWEMVSERVGPPIADQDVPASIAERRCLEVHGFVPRPGDQIAWCEDPTSNPFHLEPSITVGRINWDTDDIWTQHEIDTGSPWCGWSLYADPGRWRLLRRPSSTPTPTPTPTEGGDMPYYDYYSEAEPQRYSVTPSLGDANISDSGEYWRSTSASGWFFNPSRWHARDNLQSRLRSWGPHLRGFGQREMFGDLAAHSGLASGAAAWDCLHSLARAGYDDIPGLERSWGWPERSIRRTPFDRTSESEYIPPEVIDVTDPINHIDDCDCDRCHRASGDCQLGFHCRRCYSEGPVEAGCDCDRCERTRYPNGRPDDDEPLSLDELELSPILPAPAPDRCRFGIEIEFNTANRLAIIPDLVAQGIPAADSRYTHAVGRFWKMTTDATVSGGELVSAPLPGDDYSLAQVTDALRIIKNHGGQTGRNCGMHVHLDVTTFEMPQLKTMAKNLRTLEPFLEGFVPASRYDGTNGHCRRATPAEWNAVMRWLPTLSTEHFGASHGNRSTTAGCPVGRLAFNFNSLLPYGTIEVRLLGHTLNTVKVRTWIRVLQSIHVASSHCMAITRGDVLEWLMMHGALDQVSADRYRQVVERRGNTDQLVLASA